MRGANVTAWTTDAYGKPAAAASLSRLAATGTSHAVLITTWYVSDGRDSEPRRLAGKTPSDDSLAAAARAARERGMAVVIKPHVDPLDGSFRGHLAPADRDAWWTHYRGMALHYARLADRVGAAGYVVGTELTSMAGAGDEARWRALISDVRAVFKGELTFAANHVDDARAIGFWDALDVIGIDAYMTLGAAQSVDDLVRAWWSTPVGGHTRRYVDEIADLHERWGKDILFTELGYQSRAGSPATPWWTTSGPSSQAVQRNAYEAAFRVWQCVPWFRGIWWWDWSAEDRVDGEDGSFHSAGKLAEETLRQWHTAGACARPAQRPAGVGPRPGDARITLKLERAGRRVEAISGEVRCARDGFLRPAPGAVGLVLERWDRKRWRARGPWRARIASSAAARTEGWRISASQLPRGSYRVTAKVESGCALRSATKRFRQR